MSIAAMKQLTHPTMVALALMCTSSGDGGGSTELWWHSSDIACGSQARFHARLDG